MNLQSRSPWMGELHLAWPRKGALYLLDRARLKRRAAILVAGICALVVWTPVLGAAPGVPLIVQTAAGANPTNSGRPDPGVVRQKPVTIDLKSLGALAGHPGTGINIEIFDGQVLALILERFEQRSQNNYTWFGRAQGDPKSHVILTVVNGYLAASIVQNGGGQQPSGAYEIRPGADGIHVLREIDQRAFPPDHPPGNPIAPPFHGKSLPPAGDAVTTSATASTTVATADSGTTVDVMVVYSNQTAAAAGSGIGAQIQQAVDTANAVYANSGIATRLRLVHYEQVSYDESGDFATDLSRLTNGSDGYMDNVQSLRNAYGADLVSLFVENAQYCGYGWIGPNPDYAFTVVNRTCASGNYSFPHEIGHNFGARHDTYVDPTSTPYAYGHGWVDVAEGWRDVMAYNNACAAVATSCIRIPYFSNATMTYGSPADPLGSSTSADVARVHNDNAYAVANFRLAIVSGCTYALAPSSAGVGAGGTSGSFSVTAGTGCAWNAASNAPWIVVAVGSGTTGSGTLSYSVAANGGPARSGTVTVGGQAFTVSQDSGCTYGLTPTSASIGAGGGAGTASIATGAGCGWTAASSASWLVVTSAASGAGSASIGFSAAANTGAARSANLTVGGVTFVAAQAAAASGAATLSTVALNFGSQTVGKTSSAKTATLTNTGGASLTIQSLIQSGLNPTDFARSGTCTTGTKLASGGSCSLKYTFAPTATGTRSAYLAVTTDANSVTLNLSGSGTTAHK